MVEARNPWVMHIFSPLHTKCSLTNLEESSQSIRASLQLLSVLRDLRTSNHLVGIPDYANFVCGVLAYGDLKRVELALALTNQPRLLLMDEPTAGMEPAERKRLMDLISSIVRSRNLGALFIEHDMDVVFTHANRIIVLNRGEKIAEGTPDQVRENDNVREVYLGGEAMQPQE